MPRISPRLFRRANRHSPNVAALLPACRDLPSAINELRWLKEHVNGTTHIAKEGFLARLCTKRGQGYPLQYILGSQPFGPLDIKCRSGVLIPRPETEAYTYHLADLIKSENLKTNGSKHDLGIVDFCTGTGCIPLLLSALLYQKFDHLDILGVDISTQAIKLARGNIDHNIRLGHLPGRHLNHDLGIMQGDIFQDEVIEKLKGRNWDVMVSNPPYISRRAWNYGGGQVGYSVRKHEPPLALVPGDDIPVPRDWNHEDVFYARLLEVACHLKPRFMLLEIGDKEQARRVISRFFQHDLSINSDVQVWRDWPDLASAGDKDCLLEVPVQDRPSRAIPILGDGNIRSIFIRLDA